MAIRPFATAFLGSLVLALFLCAGVSAQGTTSRVSGTVTDTSGATVPGASVTLTNEGTSATLSTVSSDDGAYVFDLIQPGKYTITVEKQGFKKLVSTSNTVFVNQPATVNAALEVGAISEVVSVEGTAELVQTATSGNVGTTID